MLSETLVTARDLGRLNEIAAILVRHGLGDTVRRLGLSIALVIAALIIGSSIVMTVSGGPTLFGLPAFGFLGFCAAVAGALWLVCSIRQGGRHNDDKP